MERLLLALSDRSVELHGPSGPLRQLQQIWSGKESSRQPPDYRIWAEPESGDGAYRVCDSMGMVRGGLPEAGLVPIFLEALGRIQAHLTSDALALDASALRAQGRTVIAADTDGAGRMLLAAWLVDRGFELLGADQIVVDEGGGQVGGTRRALVLDGPVAALVAELDTFRDIEPIAFGSKRMWQIQTPLRPTTRPHDACGLLLFPTFEQGAALDISPLDSTEAALMLLRSIRNARNLPGGGFDAANQLAGKIPGIAIRYGSLQKLDGWLDPFLRFVTADELDAQALDQFLAGLAGARPRRGGERPRQSFPIPSPTPRTGRHRISIGMATFDDYDGVYFTLQSLRLYHPEILEESEFIVIDNNPTGPGAGSLKQIEEMTPNYRYVPFERSIGTAASRNRIFDEATGEYVVVMDCHVLAVPGSLGRLRSYFEDHSTTMDLIHGPLLQDDLSTSYTHLDPVWKTGMYGQWGDDERGRDPEAPPFEIPMHGLGLFACRRAAWPGFNDRFRGFGSEEGYIHEKVRRNGGRVLCLPFLRWIHRFQRPLGVPYPIEWEDRIRNYLIGFTELGLTTAPIVSHFNDLVGERATQAVVDAVLVELGDGGEGP